MTDLREPIDSSRSQRRNQIHGTLAEMSPSSRIIASILGVLVIVGAVLLFRGNNAPNRELLFGGRSLSEQELDSIEMSFSRSGLNNWVREGRRISIPIETRSDYLSSLQDASSLPVSIRSSVQDAIEKTTIFESSSQRLAREKHAKQQDLGNKLTAFPEIQWASVEYDVGERQGLGRDRKQSASVVVRPEGVEALSNARIERIQDFIRGSYAGMSREDVVVIDTNANDIQCQDPLMRRKLEQQARLEKEIRDILSAYGPIQVAAYVDIEKPPAPPVELTTKAAAPPTQQSDHGIIGRVINSVTQVRSNRAARIEPPQTPQPIATDRSDSAFNHHVASVRNVRVSIGLPESYYHRVWELAYQRQHVNKIPKQIPGIDPDQLQSLKDQTKANITAAVTPIVFASNQQKAAAIEVWTFPDLPSSVDVAPDFASMSFSWLGNHWQKASLVFMGLICLWLAASSLRGGSKNERLAASDKVPVEPSSPAPTILPQTSWETDSSQADLLALIDQNPDAAADVIRDWIAEAA